MLTYNVCVNIKIQVISDDCVDKKNCIFDYENVTDKIIVSIVVIVIYEKNVFVTVRCYLW